MLCPVDTVSCPDLSVDSILLTWSGYMITYNDNEGLNFWEE